MNSVSHFEKKQSPVIVYTAGKCATTTLFATLQRQGVPCRNVHRLNWRRIAELYASASEPAKLPGHARNFVEARRFIDEMRGKIRFKIVTSVREPVSWHLSSTLWHYKKNFQNRSYEPSKENIQAVNNYLLNIFDQYNQENDYLTTWFYEELKSVFGFDVFSVPFNTKRPYGIYKAPDSDILIIKVERLSVCCKEAFREFFGVNIPKIINLNTAAERESGNLYMEVKKSFSLPSETLKRVYSSKLPRHFYSPYEIANFIDRWSRKTGKICLSMYKKDTSA